MRKTFIKLLMVAMAAVGIQSCGPEWDQMDPASGNQTYATLKKMASYTFDDGTTEPLNAKEFTLFAYDEGDFPQLATEGSEVEEPRATQFLDLNGGYTRIINPLEGNAQDAVSLVFYVKQNDTEADFKEATLFSFQSADGSQQVAFTANGALVVKGVNGDFAFNSTDECTTGMLKADGEWHKVAVSIRNQNYFVFVDGEKRLDYTPLKSIYSSNIDMQQVVDFMADAPYIYIGENSYETVENKAAAYTWLIDDIDIYRNTITSKEWAYKKSSGGGGGSSSTLFKMWYNLKAYYLRAGSGSLKNGVTPSEEAVLVTEEAQTTVSGFETDAERGKVWHQQQGWVGHANGKTYLEMPNPLKGENLSEGASICFWVKQPTISWWDAIWGMNTDDIHFWFNGNGYLGFNGSGQWFDCHNDNSDNALVADTWTHVALVFTPTGFSVYYDGKEKFSDQSNAKWASSGDIDYTKVLDFLKTHETVCLGKGGFWGSADSYVSDVMYFSCPVTEEDLEYIMFVSDTTPKGMFTFMSHTNDVMNPANTGTLVVEEAQTETSKLETDGTRGKVWHQQEGWVGHANGKSHLDMVNPLYNVNLSNGATITFWVKQPTVSWWDAIWGMTDGTVHFWFNGNGYLGFNDNNGMWFDCHNDNGDNALAADTWTHVAIVLTGSGFTVYYDGVEKFSDQVNAKWAGAEVIDYSAILTYVMNTSTMSLGYGSFWGSANTFVSDMFVYGGILTEEQIQKTMKATQR